MSAWVGKESVRPVCPHWLPQLTDERCAVQVRDGGIGVSQSKTRAVGDLSRTTFTAVTRVQIPSGTDPLSRRFLASSGELGSFERVETPPRLERLLRKKVGTETTRRRMKAADAPSFDERAVFPHPHFSPAVAVSTTNYQQLPAPPVPRSCCNHSLFWP